jgi:uncharacterized membrane protein YeaQ/YmgE (transglycosylase-associated protein family)
VAGEPEVQQKSDWKKDVIIGGAVLGGLAGWHFAGTHQPGFDIVIGVVVGAFVANWVWDFSNEKSDDQESNNQNSGRSGY